MSNQVNYFCKLEKQMKPAAPLNELHYHNMTMKEFQKLFFNYKPFVVRNFSTNTPLKRWSPSLFVDQIKEKQMATVGGFMVGDSDLSSKSAYKFYDVAKIMDPSNNFYIPANNHILVQHPNMFLEYEGMTNKLLEKVNRTIVNVDMFVSNTEKVSTGSRWHSAHGTNAFIQAKGEKTWTFLEPAATICMKPYWKWNEDAIWSRHSYKELQQKIPYLKYPHYKVTLHEGDLLINPAYWWHSVKNGKGFVMGIANRLIQWHGKISVDWGPVADNDDYQQLVLSALYVYFTRQKTLLGTDADELYFWQKPKRVGTYKNCPFKFHLGNVSLAKSTGCWYWRYQDPLMENYATKDIKTIMEKNKGLYPLK